MESSEYQRPYHFLGSFAATPNHSVSLDCHHCEVSWEGCAAASCCPQCGAPKHYWPDADFGKCACERCAPSHPVE